MRGDGRAWRHQQGHTAGTGFSEWTVLWIVLTMWRLSGYHDPSASTCSFTRHPRLEMKNSSDLKTCRMGQDEDNDHCQLWKTTKMHNGNHDHPPKKNPGVPRRSWQLVSLALCVITVDLPSRHKPCGAWLLLPVSMRGSVSEWKPFSFILYFEKKHLSPCKVMDVAMTVSGLDIPFTYWCCVATVVIYS